MQKLIGNQSTPYIREVYLRYLLILVVSPDEMKWYHTDTAQIMCGEIYELTTFSIPRLLKNDTIHDTS